MLIRQFMLWAEKAPAGERAEAAGALVRAFLYADLDRFEQGEMERALTCLLDDPSPLVRRALAEALAGVAEAPHHLVAALAGDQDDIAALVLARSPVLSDAELIDAAALGGPLAQSAIARRPALSAAVAGAVAEVGCAEAALALCSNPSATLADVVVLRLLERHGDDGALRTALGQREDLGPEMRHALMVATAGALRRFVTGCRWISAERVGRVVGEASDRATMTLAREIPDDGTDRGLPRFVAYLQRSRRLTPALMLRALLSGQTAFFEAALSRLSSTPVGRVAGLLHHPQGLGFAAVYRKAALPPDLLPAFRAALAGPLVRLGPDSGCGPDRSLVGHVLEESAARRGRVIEGLTALLRRFEVEAARDEARSFSAPALARGPIDGPDPTQRIEPRFLPLNHLHAAA